MSEVIRGSVKSERRKTFFGEVLLIIVIVTIQNNLLLIQQNVVFLTGDRFLFEYFVLIQLE